MSEKRMGDICDRPQPVGPTKFDLDTPASRMGFLQRASRTALDVQTFCPPCVQPFLKLLLARKAPCDPLNPLPSFEFDSRIGKLRFPCGKRNGLTARFVLDGNGMRLVGMIATHSKQPVDCPALLGQPAGENRVSVVMVNAV